MERHDGMNPNTEPQKEHSPAADGIPLGRYSGVSVSAHWSVLVILVLLTQVLAVSVLPSGQPGAKAVTYWLTAASASVVFFAALVAHELAHAMAARHYGIAVKRISMRLLGGRTERGDEAPSPRVEAAIAAAGPATSLGLGAGFAVAAWLFDGSGLVATTLLWLAGVNMLLGVFNLLPTAPLDGGKLLRAALWHRSGDRLRASETSASAGKTLGTFLIAAGTAILLFGLVIGLWLALIGWFILGAAVGEHRAARGQWLRGMTAADVMTTPPMTAPSWWTVSDFLTHLGTVAGGRSVYPLIAFDGQPQGVLSIRDLDRVPAVERDNTRLRDAARSRARALTLAPDSPLPEVMAAIHLHGGVAVVIDGNTSVGTLTESDLAAAVTLARLGRPPAVRPLGGQSTEPIVDRSMPR
jgi:Zn-dependent protease/CBS domain-containing protein